MSAEETVRIVPPGIPLLVLLAAGLLGLSQQACSPAALPPGCTEEDASKVATECAALATACVVEGKLTPEQCEHVCDERADKRQESCS